MDCNKLINIIEYIGIKGKIKRGNYYFFLCPFHKDNHPSLSVNINNLKIRCFACSFYAKNVLDLIIRYKNEDFREIKIWLKERWGEDFFSEKKEKNIREEIFLISSKIYFHNIFTKKTKKFWDYIISRKLTEKEIVKFKIGWSLEKDQILSLLGDYYPKDELIDNNLVLFENKNGVDFFFPELIIFPIINENNSIISFIARKTSNSEKIGKYIYLKNNETDDSHDKSKILYNYQRCLNLNEKNIYLVEGIFDVISLSRLGINNSIALLGTSISSHQIFMLEKIGKTISIFFDGDTTGKEKTISISLSLLKNNIDCEIVENNSGMDPDEICIKKGRRNLENVLKNKKNPIDYIINDLWVKMNIIDNFQKIKKFIKEILNIFKNHDKHIKKFVMRRVIFKTHLKKEEIIKILSNSIYEI